MQTRRVGETKDQEFEETKGQSDEDETKTEEKKETPPVRRNVIQSVKEWDYDLQLVKGDNKPKPKVINALTKNIFILNFFRIP